MLLIISSKARFTATPHRVSWWMNFMLVSFLELLAGNSYG